MMACRALASVNRRTRAWLCGSSWTANSAAFPPMFTCASRTTWPQSPLPSKRCAPSNATARKCSKRHSRALTPSRHRTTSWPAAGATCWTTTATTSKKPACATTRHGNTPTRTTAAARSNSMKCSVHGSRRTQRLEAAMAENTKIEWAHHTFTGWEGCTKVGPGCDHCYAEARNQRFHGGNWGRGAPRRRTSEANWRQPLKWNREAERLGIRYRVFCASLADVFDNEVPDSWRMDLSSLIAKTSHLDWLLLTKRIGNVAPYCQRDSLMFDLMADGRVWIGAT